MNKAHFVATLILIAIAFSGCIIPGARKERAEIELQRNDSLFVIDQGDFRFRLVLPKDLMISHTPEIQLHEEQNRLEISCGPTFHLFAEITDAQRNHVPSQIGVFHCNVIDDEDNSCVYSRSLPDGQVFDFGLTQHTKIEETHYAFYSDVEGEFTLQDVLKMRTTLASIKM